MMGPPERRDPDWVGQLQHSLEQLNQQHLRRTLRPIDRCGATVRRGDRTLLNLASNDYLGLATHPRLIEAVRDAAERSGVGSGASRLVSGTLEAHAALEQRFAEFKHAEAALLLPTGYMANLAALTTLVRTGDLVCLDKLNHASLIDAARASGATVRVFPHLGYEKLERLLAESDAPRKLIVSDSVFSMDGDTADLKRLVELRDRFGAILVVDDAHGTGVLGEFGAGLAEAQGVAGRVDVTVSTASKGMGSLGGIITASRLVIDTLINSARSFIYTTAVPPTQVAAIDAALDVIRDEPDRRLRLREIAKQVRSALRAIGFAVSDDPTPIVPLITGSPESALALAEHLEASGILAPGIRPPTVAPNSSRVRLSLRADLTDSQLDHLLDSLRGTPRS